MNGTGPFAAFGPYSARHKRAATDVPIQVAAAVALDDGTRTDATVPLDSAPPDTAPLDSGPTPTMADGGESTDTADNRRESGPLPTQTDAAGRTSEDGPKSVADADTSGYGDGETVVSPNFLAFAEETIRDQPRELEWLELRVNVVLFPFREYKTDDFARDIAAANKIFEGCRIGVKLGSTTILTEEHTRKAGRIYQSNRREPARAILDPAKLAGVAGPKAQGEATVYYVPEIRNGAAGQKISNDTAVVAFKGRSGNRRQPRVLAHELAHVMKLPHDRSDVRKLMIDINERHLEALGIQRQWEQFKKQYKGPIATATDLRKRFDSFMYRITANSIRVPRDECKRMRKSPLLDAVK